MWTEKYSPAGLRNYHFRILFVKLLPETSIKQLRVDPRQHWRLKYPLIGIHPLICKLTI